MTTSNHKLFDVYGNTDKLEKPVLDVIVTRLEERGQHPRFTEMMHEYFDVMQLSEAQTVLDIGCGTGVATRALAQRSDFQGKITGIDLSDHLIDVAKQLAKDDNVGNKIDFQVGDTRGLNIPDNSFDVVIAHTLLSHVDDCHTAVDEMARVVKPQGYVAIFDGDYASLTFGHPDPEEGKRIDDLIISAVITQPRVMRQMPRILKNAGLDLSTSFAHVLSEMGEANFWASSVNSFRNLLPTVGVMTKEEATTWADERMKDSDEGVFFGSSNYLTYVARKP